MSNYASANENGKKKLLIKLFETCTTFFISSFQKHDPFTISIRSPGLPPDPQQVNQPILVCTAHIHWDPEFCDVKLIQTMMLSYELKGILEEASHSFRPGHIPSNSLPLTAKTLCRLPITRECKSFFSFYYFQLCLIELFLCFQV